MGETVMDWHSDRGSTPLRSIRTEALRKERFFCNLMVNDIDTMHFS